MDTKRTKITSKHTKVVELNWNEKYYKCPAFDHEDVALETLGTHERLGDRKPSISELLLKGKNVVKKEAFIVRTVRFIMKKFFATVIEDVIRNNVVFVFPKGYAYIVAAQQSPTVEGYKYNMKYGQGKVMVMLVYSKQGYAISKGRKKYIHLAPKYKKMIKQELENGRKYPVIDNVMSEMNY